MQFSSHFQACIEVLETCFELSMPIDKILSSYYRRRRYIGSKDKAAISEHVYHVLRKKLSYGGVLSANTIPVNYPNVVALYASLQGFNLSRIFTGNPYHPSKLLPDDEAKIRKINLESLEQLPSNEKLNLPKWLVPYFESALGDSYVQEVTAMNERASLDIRVNTLLKTVENLSQVFDDQGVSYERGQLSPWAMRLHDKGAISQMQEFKQGMFEVQDEGSQLIALLSGVKPGDRVTDFCAGAGGKSLAMAAMMQNKGRIIAMDVHSKRLQQLVKRARRSKVFNIQTCELKSEYDSVLKRQFGKSDVVLVDAPCSGTGTWRRNPDGRYHLKQENLNNLIQLQSSILKQASKLVKPGGRLLYATCSLLKEENEHQVERFLQNNHQFSYDELGFQPPLTSKLDCVISDAHQLRCTPHLSKTDGFYMVALRRLVA